MDNEPERRGGVASVEITHAPATWCHFQLRRCVAPWKAAPMPVSQVRGSFRPPMPSC